MRLDIADVRDSLTAEQVIHHYGLKAKRRGSQFRLALCPRCQEKSQREAIAIDAQTGSWLHHGAERAAGGSCSGDLLDLVAACEGLTCSRDFSKVIQIAASIAGVTSISDVERDLRRAQAHERARRDAALELERNASARTTALTAWDSLEMRTEEGVRFLSQRGLDPDLLISSQSVRFSRDGIVVAIRDVDGCPVSTATRLYDPGTRPKVLALKGHSTRGTMIDATRDIVGDRDVVIVEGVMDSLTARLAYPRATVLGANGAGKILEVTNAAIVRAKLAGTRILLVPHDDARGIAAATEAGRAAIAAGLELDDQLEIVSLPTKDLNDAWSTGWRP